MGISEEATVRNASFDSTNNGSLLLKAQSICIKTIVLNTAVVKGSEQNSVATIVNFMADLPDKENAIIIVDLSNINLNPENYTANLWTTNSHVISSPFIIRSYR